MNGQKNKYSGMTLNEMLFEAGLVKEFDNAIGRKDKVALIQTLKKVNIPQESAEQIIKTIFDNPEKYGFKK